MNLSEILKSAQLWVEGSRSTTTESAASALREVTGRVELGRDGIKLSLRLPLPTLATGGTEARGYLALTRFVPTVMKRRGVEQRLALEGTSAPTEVYQPLLKQSAALGNGSPS